MIDGESIKQSCFSPESVHLEIMIKISQDLRAKRHLKHKLKVDIYTITQKLILLDKKVSTINRAFQSFEDVDHLEAFEMNSKSEIQQ